MRIPWPSWWILARARRAAGCAPGTSIARIRILPQRIEILVDGGAEPVHVTPRGWRAVALVVLAPLFHVVIARGRARLHLRVGGLPYALDALVHQAPARRLPYRSGSTASL